MFIIEFTKLSLVSGNWTRNFTKCPECLELWSDDGFLLKLQSLEDMLLKISYGHIEGNPMTNPSASVESWLKSESSEKFSKCSKIL